jgi:Bacterial PH domain
MRRLDRGRDRKGYVEVRIEDWILLPVIGLFVALCFFAWSVSFFFAVAYKILRAVTTKVSIHHARISLNYGILSRHQINMEIHRVRELSMDQSFINRILGQGSLVLCLDAGASRVPDFRIPGLVAATQLPELVWKIRDAAQKLRQYAKGIMQL